MNPQSPDPAQPIPKDRLRSIDALRGLAVIAVVMMHIPSDATGGWRGNPFVLPSFLMKYGYWGVTLFILLSGFCIHRKAAVEKSRRNIYAVSWIAFWKRRFWRLYPPYLAAIGIGLLTAVALEIPPDDKWLGRLEPQHFDMDLTCHLLMVHNLTVEYAEGLKNGVYWTLGLEEQLYLLYPLLLVLLSRMRLSLVLASIAAITILWRLATHSMSPITISSALSIGNYDAFPFAFWLHWLLGAIAVDAAVGARKLPPMAYRPAFGFGLLLAGMVLNEHAIEFAGTAGWIRNPALLSNAPQIERVENLFVLAAMFVLLCWSVANEDHPVFRRKLVSLMEFVGMASYSIYLVHVPSIFVLRHYYEGGNTGLAWLLRTSAYFTVSMVSGLLFYWSIERWFALGIFPGRLVRGDSKGRTPASAIGQIRSELSEVKDA